MSTKTKDRLIKLRFVLLQVLYWCGVASFFAFMVALLRHKGMSASFIGIIMASYRLSSILGQFFWGNVCDRFQTNKPIFIISNILCFVSAYFIFISHGGWQIFASCMMLGFCQTPTYTNMDTWLIKYYDGRSAVFGPARAAGSLAFGVFTFFYGSLIAKLGYGIMPYFQFMFISLCTLNAIFTPQAGDSENAKSIKLPKPSKRDVKELFSQKEFVFLLIILLFDGFAVSSISQMMTLVWENLNAPISFIGYHLFASTVAQVPILLSMARLQTVMPAKRLAAAVVLDLTMLVLIFLAKKPSLVLISSALSGVSYAIFVSSMREVIVKSAPKNLSTTAQGIGDAVFASLAPMIGAIVSGMVIDSLGVKNLALLCASVQIIPLIFVFNRLRSKNHAS